MSYNIAVVGATGNVGREVLSILSDSKFPINKVFALASARSAGKKISFGDETIEVQDLAAFDFSECDVAIFSAGSKVSKEFAPIAAQFCIVIDNTSYFRMQSDIPLIIPEVNGTEIANFANQNIIANPNCVVAQIAVAIAPLHKVNPIKRLVITSLQSVSGAGKKAMDELYDQTKAKLLYSELKCEVFDRPIAFNALPKIGEILDNGYSEEEIKIVQEIQKILSADIKVTATCVRVPVFIGHSVSINVEFEEPMLVTEACDLLYESSGIALIDSESGTQYISPSECVGDDEVYVSRVRADQSNPNALNFWIVADNLRKGAALNAVQIAQELVQNYL